MNDVLEKITSSLCWVAGVHTLQHSNDVKLTCNLSLFLFWLHIPSFPLALRFPRPHPLVQRRLAAVCRTGRVYNDKDVWKPSALPDLCL